jgi:hypothetical protein
MTDLLPQYREPMCGWPKDLNVCEHNLPADECWMVEHHD